MGSPLPSMLIEFGPLSHSETLMVLLAANDGPADAAASSAVAKVNQFLRESVMIFSSVG
jgi:hypothetical protein